MIVSRAPMLLTFLGNSGYTKKVVSTTIDKYSYAVVNQTPLVNSISARYSMSELVDDIKSLKNDRIRNSLEILGVLNNIEVGTFASFPLEVGFSSRASYSASVLIALMNFKLGFVESKKLCGLIESVEKLSGSVVSNHTPHAIVNGGLAKYIFDKEKVVISAPIFLNFTTKHELENSMVIYHVSTSKPIKMSQEKHNIDPKEADHLDNLIDVFANSLEIGDLPQIAYWLHKGWLVEKKVGFNIPNKIVDSAFEIGFQNGALGGKYIGDIYSGCLLFINQDNRQGMSKAIKKHFINNNIKKYHEYSIKLTQSGTNILLDTER